MHSGQSMPPTLGAANHLAPGMPAYADQGVDNPGNESGGSSSGEKKGTGTKPGQGQL